MYTKWDCWQVGSRQMVYVRQWDQNKSMNMFTHIENLLTSVIETLIQEQQMSSNTLDPRHWSKKKLLTTGTDRTQKCNTSTQKDVMCIDLKLQVYEHNKCYIRAHRYIDLRIYSLVQVNRAFHGNMILNEFSASCLYATASTMSLHAIKLTEVPSLYTCPWTCSHLMHCIVKQPLSS